MKSTPCQISSYCKSLILQYILSFTPIEYLSLINTASNLVILDKFCTHDFPMTLIVQFAVSSLWKSDDILYPHTVWWSLDSLSTLQPHVDKACSQRQCILSKNNSEIGFANFAGYWMCYAGTEHWENRMFFKGVKVIQESGRTQPLESFRSPWKMLPIIYRERNHLRISAFMQRDKLSSCPLAKLWRNRSTGNRGGAPHRRPHEFFTSSTTVLMGPLKYLPYCMEKLSANHEE